MAGPLEKLGKYTLERRIAAGGMAEVFLATDDSGKRCVIKRMLPSLQVDKHFARMFLDEARLVVQLNHPSIAQIYDFGQDRGVLYLAMEWVDGTNLRTIVKDFARRSAKIPVEHCARLVSQVALALGYAHRAAGLDGKPLKIIHRDVSPQNALLGSTGTVKLIDFGVAKATSASQQTAAGMIKGKFAYMSPEQLRGNPLDGRSDIYGLGLVLYELLAAERAVPGNSEAEIAQNALTKSIPPIGARRADIPAPLAAILTRALASDRNARYDTAEDFAAELETFITPRMPKLCGADLAKLLPAPSHGNPAESGSDHKMIPFWDAAPSAAEAAAPTVTRPGSDEAPTLRPVARQTAVPSAQVWNPAPYERVAKTVINPPGLVPVGRQPPPSAPPGSKNTIRDLEAAGLAPRSRLRWFAAASAIGFLLAAAGWWALKETPAPDPVAAAEPVIAEPAPAPVAPPEPPPRPTEAVAPAPATAPAAVATAARLKVTAAVPARVTLDGKSLGTTPLELAVSPGTHQLGFEDLAGAARHSRKIVLKPREVRSETWTLEPGRVLIRATPWAEVFVNGKSLGLTPLEPINLAAGKHTFRFVNSETHRENEQTVEVKPKADTMVKVDLRSAP